MLGIDTHMKYLNIVGNDISRTACVLQDLMCILFILGLVTLLLPAVVTELHKLIMVASFDQQM